MDLELRDTQGAKKLAWNITRMIKNPKTEPPITIALNGEWGSGKSSVMKLTKAYLEHYGHYVAWVDPWHAQVSANLTLPFELITNAEYRTYIVSIAASLGAFVFLFLPRCFSVFTAIGGRGVIKKFIDRFCTRTNEEPATLYRRFGKEYKTCVQALRKTGSGLTIIIDDLDRCLADRVGETLDLINMLSLSGPAIVILGIDRDKVEDAIALRRQRAIAGSADKQVACRFDPRVEAQSYLKKLINIDINLKDYQQNYQEDQTRDAELWQKTLIRARKFLRWDRWIRRISASVMPLLLVLIIAVAYFALDPQSMILLDI